MKLTLGILLLAVGAAVAQVTTNWVTGPSNLRVVDGRLYNVDKSTNWLELVGECDRVLTNGIVFQQISYDPPWDDPITHPRTSKHYGKVIGVKNYPINPKPITGVKMKFKAMKTPRTMDYGSQVLEVWEYGLPHRVAVVTTNKPAAK